MIDIHKYFGGIHMYNDKRTKSDNINNKLVMYRLLRHYTQQQVADLANIARPYYVKIENGQCTPSINTYKDIARALGVPNWKELINE